MCFEDIPALFQIVHEEYHNIEGFSLVEIRFRELMGYKSFIQLEYMGSESAELRELFAVLESIRSNPQELSEHLDFKQRREHSAKII